MNFKLVFRVSGKVLLVEAACMLLPLAVALLYGDDAVTQDVLRSRFQAILPFATTNPDAVQRLRAWGRNRAVAASEQTSTREADTK